MNKGNCMVSMFVDIRQAAELLARFSSGHGLPRVAIGIANEIANAARQNGLQFYTQYRDPVDGMLKVDKPANILGSSFWIDTDDKGLLFVRPNGKIEGAVEKVFAEASGYQHNPSPHDGEWVADCVVSIEDVVMHPNFGFHKEKQDAILEAHKAAVLSKQTMKRRISIQALWLSGEFKNRDLCAKKYWKATGHANFTHARLNLRINQ